ncbi:prepilin peptidase [Photobacterium sp. 53610]|uniref:prepilin peptidase n=1 Tax=Photobacterium sp. 53610 TaxID=3102789 RepID=UPI003FA6B6DD
MILQSILIVLLILCSAQDLKEHRIHNFLVVLFIFGVLFFLLNKVDIQLEGWRITNLFSFFFVCFLTLPFFYKGLFGAADVKILLALSVISSFDVILNILLYSFLCFAVFWWLFVRDQKEAPFVPSLLVGVVVSLWIV